MTTTRCDILFNRLFYSCCSRQGCYNDGNDNSNGNRWKKNKNQCIDMQDHRCGDDNGGESCDGTTGSKNGTLQAQ